MAVRVGVGERRVVDHLDAGSVGVDCEEGRKPVVAVDDVGHHDQDRGDVAGRHEPLLAVQAKAVGGALGRRGDAAGVRAGVPLGDGVGVADLAAKGGEEVALDLRVGSVVPDVVGVRDVPVDRVGRAAELLFDQRPLERRPALAAVLGLVEAADEAGVDRLGLDVVDRVLGQAAEAALGLLLEREEDVLDESARARLDVPSPVRELERGLLDARR